jgi:hypothetical protein
MTLESLARHEAGHVIAQFAVGDPERIESVSIDPSPALQAAGTAGLVRKVGGATDDQMAIQRELPDVRNLFRNLREPDPSNPAEWERIGVVGAIAYAGVAGQFAGLCSIDSDAYWAAHLDQIEFEHLLAARMRIFWSRHRWCWPAFDAAARIVDPRWGQLLAVAKALLAKKTVFAPELHDLIAKAPEIVNDRPRWR